MNIRKVITFAVLIQFLIPTSVHGGELKAPCRLQIGIAHISTNLFENSRIRAVKVNASSICNVPQSNVTITVEIWKTGVFGNHFVVKRTVKSLGTTLPNSRLDNFKTFRVCKNDTPTSYYGVAYSQAFIAGKWKYARQVLSTKIIPLECGT